MSAGSDAIVFAIRIDERFPPRGRGLYQRVGECHTQNFVEIRLQVRGPEPVKAEGSRARAEGPRARAFEDQKNKKIKKIKKFKKSRNQNKFGQSVSWSVGRKKVEKIKN